MALDIPTLAIIESLILITLVIALFMQYRVNKTYQGIGWWLAGTALLSAGSIFTYFFVIKPLELLARIANPLIVLGYLFIYIGIVRYFEQKENRRLLAVAYGLFLLWYYYFMFVHNDISGRAVVISTVTALIGLGTAYTLIMNKDRLLSDSIRFTASSFLIYGLFMAARAVYTLMMPPILSYAEFVQIPFHFFAYVVPILASTLWTFGLIIMVNQRLNAEIRLEKEKMQLVFNTSPDAALITRLADGLVIDANNGFSVLTGHARHEIIGSTTIEISMWHDSFDRSALVSMLLEQGSCENREFLFRRKDGSPFDGVISARIITIHGAPHIVSVVRNITDQKVAERALRESEDTYRSILNASPDDITITDLEARILMVSPAAKKIFGYPADYQGFEGTHLLDYIVPEDAERARANILHMYQGGTTIPNEYRGIRRDGTLFDIEVNSGFIRNAEGQPVKMVFIVRNISERKQTEQQIQKLVQQLEIERNAAQLSSRTDSLTGLANRRCFDETLNTEFFRLKRSGAPLSLILLDVDHFKKYNDYYGHLAGDDCLRQLGAVLKIIPERSADIAARYGGEEFVVILPETEGAGAEEMAEYIRKAVEALAIPHADSETAPWVTVSLGVVTIHASGFTSPEQVLVLADQEMYRAKQKGRNQVSARSGGQQTSPALSVK